MVDLAGAAVVAILTRAPSAGGKSRLFGAIGRPPDPGLLSALLLDTVDGTAVNGVTRLIAVDPPNACDEIRRLVPGIEVVPQIAGSLGARMAAVMESAFARGAAVVAVVGSDLPDIEPHVFVDAFAALARDPQGLALGPAADGGYYLIAATRTPPVFDGIDWGSDRVFDQTVTAAERDGIRVHVLEPMADVDSVEDLRRVAAPRTVAWRRAHGFA